LYCPAVGLAFIPFIVAFFQSNYFLGTSRNAVTNVGNNGLPLEEKEQDPELPPPKNIKEVFLRFWADK